MKHVAVVQRGVSEYVEVEGSAQVLLVGLIPVISGEPDLKGVHARAIVLQFLVPILNSIVIVLLIVKAHVESCKIMRVNG